MTPEEYCREKAAQSGSSFYYSFLFLPAEKRNSIIALYAFCREVDDAVDESRERAVAAAKLAWWRAEVAQLFAGRPQHPVTRALAGAVERFDITHQHLNEIMDGMEMDLTQSRYPDFAALQRYCHRVAGVVGTLAAAIFGYSNPRTLDYADRLGLAFQLTNIIRDVGEDARNDRIYLPMDELLKFDVPVADIISAHHTENFARLMRFQTERALRCYDEAFALLPPEDRRTQRPGLVMAGIYKTLLEEIAADGYQVLRQRIALTPVRKLWIAWRTWVTA